MGEDTVGLAVRAAGLDEAAVVAHTLQAAFAPYAPQYSAAALAATTPTEAQLRQRWPEGPVWVAQINGRAVGTVAAVIKGDSLYVRSMAVLPDARGHGLGRLLLEEVERYARARALRRLYLSTTPFLERAIRLYEGFGFRRTEAGPHALFGTPLFTMEKVLERDP